MGTDRTDDLAFHLAQLRHLYAQMWRNQVRNTAEAARGLLGPAIECLEKVHASNPASPPCPAREPGTGQVGERVRIVGYPLDSWNGRTGVVATVLVTGMRLIAMDDENISAGIAPAYLDPLHPVGKCPGPAATPPSTDDRYARIVAAAKRNVGLSSEATDEALEERMVAGANVLGPPPAASHSAVAGVWPMTIREALRQIAELNDTTPGTFDDFAEVAAPLALSIYAAGIARGRDDAAKVVAMRALTVQSALAFIVTLPAPAPSLDDEIEVPTDAR